ncbi:adenosylhomocysteine nucleosidase [Pseudobutyrivibrio sp. ACV-2]|uniref:5'-methylthioadenosine/S-adenosylhomocysteine nucleosidase n=1 Tax=Pseudobutyrivibrio sp. ACV-2 TaxID=1520801 RepID=UPI0008963151|nr:5'-methylthioadenosine/S-adenosylhomocysteine nucleosidase [Pseudobutyrivibrio sp. ACV-2]SEA20262.1 adenosylhomocysteine nucleosidase [Pseudobutyrivibrio sp. ACV-2]
MKNVLVVSALPQETDYIDEYLKDKPQWQKQNEGEFINADKDIHLHVRVLGVGKVNAAFQTADAINDVQPELIVNVGVAGGLADDLDRGAVAIGTDYVQVDMKTLLPENSPVIESTPDYILEGILEVAKANNITYRAGRIATGDFVLYERRKRRAIKKEFNPIAFDMETAAVAQVATAKKIDFVGIRSFSDMANKKTIGLLSKKENVKASEKSLRETILRTPAKLIIDYLEND